MDIRRWLPGLILFACSGLLQAQEVKLHAVLDGASVVSATESPATGEASAVLGDDGKLKLDLIYGGLASDVTGASLHIGKSSENGPQVLTLDVQTNQADGSLVDEQLTLTDAVAQRMRDGETYLLVTTIDHPDGAIRGQLQPQPVRLDDLSASTPQAMPQTAPETVPEATPVTSQEPG